MAELSPCPSPISGSGYNRGMKIALSLLLLLAPAFAAEPASKAEKEVLATVDAWKTAMVKGDAAALDRLYHPNLIYEHSTAKNETKAEAIADATARAPFPKASSCIRRLSISTAIPPR